MTYEKIVTLFDTAQHAEAAKRNLLNESVPEDRIVVTGNTSAWRGKAAFAGFAPTKAAQRGAA